MDATIYSFTSPIWRYHAPEAWYFITLPADITEELEARFGKRKRAWATLPVRVTVGNTTWDTSLFADKQRAAFLLPIKVQVRKQERLVDDAPVDVSLTVRLE